MLQVAMRVKGHLDQSWSDWFDGLIIRYIEDDVTEISGQIPDQAALYGLVAKARDIGLPLLSLNLLEDAPPNEESENLTHQVPQRKGGHGNRKYVETKRRSGTGLCRVR